MNAKRFLAEFGYIASAPGGVQRIRELVLQLAVSGNLTTRVAGDTPASDLYAYNREEQARLIAQGQLQHQHAPMKITERDQPWRLPEGWLWCRLGEVTSYGYALKAEFEDVDAQTWVLELEDIEKGTSRLIQRVRASDRKFKSTKNQFRKGAVLYGKLRPNLNKVLIADKEGVCSTEIAPISFFSGIESGYLRWYLKSPFFIAYAINSTHGMNLPRLGTDAARNAPFPFPPAKEQEHIVAKVDELMALCDKLEAQQQERETLFKHTRSAALDTLANAKLSEELVPAWERVTRHISMLVRSGEDISLLQDVIFQLGVTGKLTSGVSEGLSVVFAENQRRTAYESDVQELHERNARVPSLPMFKLAISPEKPNGWLALTLESACTFIVDCAHSTPEFTHNGYYCIDTTCIRPRTILWLQARKVAASTFAERINRLKPRSGDVLFSREGTIGTAVAIREDVELCLGQRMMMFRFAPYVLPEFAEIYLLSGFFKQQFASHIKGTAAKHLNIEDIRQLTILVPSLLVQHSIVRIVDQLADHCQNLNELFAQASSTATSLSVAAVAAITGIRIEDKEKMKVPKTELVSNLRIGISPTYGEPAPLAAILTRNSDELSAKTLWNASGLEIDAFYQQLKIEMAKGWIVQPELAYMKEVEVS